jgi:hypothetical protein
MLDRLAVADQGIVVGAFDLQRGILIEFDSELERNRNAGRCSVAGTRRGQARPCTAGEQRQGSGAFGRRKFDRLAQYAGHRRHPTKPRIPEPIPIARLVQCQTPFLFESAPLGDRHRASRARASSTEAGGVELRVEQPHRCERQPHQRIDRIAATVSGGRIRDDSQLNRIEFSGTCRLLPGYPIGAAIDDPRPAVGAGSSNGRRSAAGLLSKSSARATANESSVASSATTESPASLRQ